MKYAVLAGRQLFSLIFIISSARHFSSPAIASDFGADPLSLDALISQQQELIP